MLSSRNIQLMIPQAPYNLLKYNIDVLLNSNIKKNMK